MKNNPRQEKVRIVAKQKIGRDYFKLSLCSPRISALAQAGQFVVIRASTGDVPLLRRPFGVHHVGKASFDILVEVVGTATKILSQKKQGEYLDVIGPLGNGFRFGTQGTRHKTQVLVAGGMGVAPLFFLAEKLKGIPKVVLIGARNKKQVLCEKEFKKLGCDVKIATDDGSKGFKGKVTELLREILVTGRKHATIYACGPKPMLKEISRIAKNNNLSGQISLEEHMSCGIGACLGCVVKTKTGLKRVCKEGPVFAAKDIIWA